MTKKKSVRRKVTPSTKPAAVKIAQTSTEEEPAEVYIFISVVRGHPTIHEVNTLAEVREAARQTLRHGGVGSTYVVAAKGKRMQVYYSNYPSNPEIVIVDPDTGDRLSTADQEGKADFVEVTDGLLSQSSRRESEEPVAGAKKEWSPDEMSENPDDLFGIA